MHEDGTFFYKDGNKKYEGVMTNNKPEGQGTYYYEDGTKYVGGFKQGEFAGKGTKYNPDGTVKQKGSW